MSEDALLSPAEVIQLTGKRRSSAQSRALRAMGVRHIVRPDGHVIVARALVVAMLGRYSEKPREPGADASAFNPAALLPRGKR